MFILFYSILFYSTVRLLRHNFCKLTENILQAVFDLSGETGPRKQVSESLQKNWRSRQVAAKSDAFHGQSGITAINSAMHFFKK